MNLSSRANSGGKDGPAETVSFRRISRRLTATVHDVFKNANGITGGCRRRTGFEAQKKKCIRVFLTKKTGARD